MSGSLNPFINHIYKFTLAAGENSNSPEEYVTMSVSTETFM